MDEGMSFEDFKTSREDMDSHEFGRRIGDAMFDDEPPFTVLVYAGSYWIRATDEGYHLQVECDEFFSPPHTLSDLERELYDWAREQ